VPAPAAGRGTPVALQTGGRAEGFPNYLRFLQGIPGFFSFFSGGIFLRFSHGFQDFSRGFWFFPKVPEFPGGFRNFPGFLDFPGVSGFPEGFS
jgi:hypothetical protein